MILRIWVLLLKQKAKIDCEKWLEVNSMAVTSTALPPSASIRRRPSHLVWNARFSLSYMKFLSFSRAFSVLVNAERSCAPWPECESHMDYRNDWIPDRCVICCVRFFGYRPHSACTPRSAFCGVYGMQDEMRRNICSGAMSSIWSDRACNCHLSKQLWRPHGAIVGHPTPHNTYRWLGRHLTDYEQAHLYW